jgi:hypothetical protein
MKITDKQVEAALKQLPFDYPTTLQPYVVRHMIEAAMQAAPAVEQKPVGSVVNISYPNSSDTTKYLTATITDASRCKAGDYLYIHPQPKREPLSDSEIKQIFERSIGLMYWDFAKAIEKAHGIGAE